MSNLHDALNDLASAGEHEYETATAPAGYDEAFVGGVRGSRRRHQAFGAVVAVAAIGVVAGVGMSLGTAEPTPAASPGDELWSTDLGGPAWSSPAFVDGLVIAGSDQGFVRAFDVTTGEQRWQLTLTGAVRADITPVADGVLVMDDDGVLSRISSGGGFDWVHTIDSGIGEREAFDQVSAAPVVAGDIAVVAGHSGVISAVDLVSGEAVWTADAGAPVSATPAVSATTAYVADTAGTMHALNLGDGTERWTAQLAEGVYSSPGVVGDVVVSGSRGTAVVGLDADTGDELWRVGLGTSWAESSVEVHEGTAFVGSSNSGAVLAIDAASGDVKWRAAIGGWPWARPTYADGQVFAATAWLEGGVVPAGSLATLDALNGDVMWDAQMGGTSEWIPDGPVAGVIAAPAVTEGLVAVVALDGTLGIFAR